MGIELIKVLILYSLEFYLKHYNNLTIYVLNFLIITPPLIYSCNCSIIIVFISALYYNLISINILYHFNTIKAIILALILV
jgi:hypothetical protein